MSVVLDQSYGTPFSGGTTSTLTANSARIGADGIISSGPITAGQGTGVQGSTFYGALTISDDAPAGASRTTASSFTQYASATAGGGLGVNQLQKFAYGDPLITGTAVGATAQEYEQGGWVQNTSTALGSGGNAIFINRPNVFTRPLNDLVASGTFTANFTNPPVIVVPNITANSRVRIAVVGGSSSAFTTWNSASASPPTITIQVNANPALSTFTATGGPTALIWAYEVLFA